MRYTPQIQYRPQLIVITCTLYVHVVLIFPIRWCSPLALLATGSLSSNHCWHTIATWKALEQKNKCTCTCMYSKYTYSLVHVNYLHVHVHVWAYKVHIHVHVYICLALHSNQYLPPTGCEFGRGLGMNVCERGYLGMGWLAR